MADINSQANAAVLSAPVSAVAEPRGRAGARDRQSANRHGIPPELPRDQKLVTFVELLFFAYRDFTGEADAVLNAYGLGRAHHRVLHFVNRSPGLKVAELLDILKITKQSLARVLKELVDRGWIIQLEGTSDRRQRLLHTTEKGLALSRRLDSLQARRVDEALRACGCQNSEVVAQFLLAMTSPEEREKVWALLPAAAEVAPVP